jgi:hypothetical protein
LNICFDSHSPDELLEKYAMGSASGLEVASLEEHLLLCADCQTHLAKTEEYLAIIRAALLELETRAEPRIPVQSTLAL